MYGPNTLWGLPFRAALREEPRCSKGEPRTFLTAGRANVTATATATDDTGESTQRHVTTAIVLRG
ncbi:MAG: hypothetical protein DMG01_21320 [Acidobacteria bacterium]|nr:MAG: hypothetical protein DMG01_21320 [Acidobacteriota bacterium]